MSAVRTLAGGLAVAAAVSSGAAIAPTAVAAQAVAPAADCPDAVTSNAGIWLVGQVRDPGASVALPGAEVEVTWREAGELRRATTEAGPSGEYRFCGIPPDLHLTVSASAVGRAGGMHAVDTRAGEPVVRQDLAVALNRICRGGACGNEVVIRGCGGGGGSPAVFLDGIEYDFARGSVRGIDEIPMQDIRAVEVYRSPAEMPGEFYTTSAHCAVVLWTKKGPDR